MPFNNLRDFLGALEKRGELMRIKEKVSPILEITEWADRAVDRTCGVVDRVVRHV